MVAPIILSIIEAKKPQIVRSTIIGIVIVDMISVPLRIMHKLPNTAELVPINDTAPELPFSIGLKVVISLGLALLKTPSSVDQVSAFAVASDTRYR